MLNPYMHNDAAYIGTAEKVNRPSRNNEIHALNAVLNPYGLKVDKVIEGISIVSFVVNLDAETPLNKIKKLNYSIVLNDNRVTFEQNGATLIINKPQEKRQPVFLGNLYNKQFMENGARKPLMMIGQTQDGHNIYKNLATCPHMLVSGTTGSGKSVFLHQVICSLLLNHNDDIEYYGIDMKGTEFRKYGALQNFHFVSDTNAAVSTLKNLCDEMDRRYEVFASYGITEFEQANFKRIVVLIDEFADLMIKHGKFVEPYVVRLAQKARACGIHLIIATQYPKADVVTGLIKANIPCRVALKLNSGTQSRVAIDRLGAEKLLGNGDMLFDPNNANIGIMHLQAAYVSPMEIENIVNMAYDIECRNRPIIRQEPKKKGICNRIMGFFNRYAYNA